MHGWGSFRRYLNKPQKETSHLIAWSVARNISKIGERPVASENKIEAAMSSTLRLYKYIGYPFNYILDKIFFLLNKNKICHSQELVTIYG